MRNIRRNIGDSVRQGRSAPAVVIDVAGSRVTVRLSTRGAVYRNLNMVGGPVSIGDLVHVDFTTDEPTVVAPGRPYDVQLEELEQFAEPITTLIEEEPPATIPDQIEVRPPDYTSGSGGGWIPPATSGSFFPATLTGMTNACAAATKDHWILLPPLEIPGNHWVGNYITMVGYSGGGTILTGEIGFQTGYRVRDVKFVRSVVSADDKCAAFIHGNGYFYNCEFTCENYGAGLGVGVMNQWATCSVVFDNCNFGGADFGIWGNPGGGYDSLYLFGTYYVTNVGGWSAKSSVLNFNTVRFTGYDSFGAGEWTVDSVLGVFLTPLYSKPAGAYVKIICDCPISGHGEWNYYSSVTGNGHSFEDASWINTLGGSPYDWASPEIPYQDEGHFQLAYGSGYTMYGPGATLTKTMYYQDYGVGSDDSSGSAGGQTPYTSTNWNNPPNHQNPWAYFYLTRWMGATTGSDPRLNQNGYDLDIRFRYAYVYDLSGWKQWIYPSLFYARLYQCNFATNSYNIVSQNYCHVVVDGYTYKGLSYSGTVTLDADLNVAKFSYTEPESPYPGQLWFPYG